MRGPRSWSRIRFRSIRVKAIVVETGVVEPAANSASNVSFGRRQLDGVEGALRERAAERAPALVEVLDLLGVRARVVVRRVLQLVVGDRQLEAVAEDLELLLRELLRLVGDVPRLDARPERPALDRLREDHGRRAAVLDRRLVRREDLAVVVAAAAELRQVVVGQVLDELLQSRIRPEEVLADVRARRRPRTSGTRRRPSRSSPRPATPSTSRARSSSHSRPQMTLMTFQPEPRKTASSSWMILPLPRTGPSRRCRLQLTTKVRLSRPSRAATVSAPSASGSSVSPSPRNAQTREPDVSTRPRFWR